MVLQFYSTLCGWIIHKFGVLNTLGETSRQLTCGIYFNGAILRLLFFNPNCYHCHYKSLYQRDVHHVSMKRQHIIASHKPNLNYLIIFKWLIIQHDNNKHNTNHGKKWLGYWMTNDSKACLFNMFLVCVHLKSDFSCLLN